MVANGKIVASKESVTNAGRTLTIILPFRLPTWNALLGMHPWQRKKVRDAIHAAISTFTPEQIDSAIQMGVPLKLSWTDLQKQEYLKTILPSSSAKYRNRKNQPKATKKR